MSINIKSGKIKIVCCVACMALIILFALVLAGAIHSRYVDDLYYEDTLNATGSYSTAKLTAGPGCGGTIRVWFDNSSDTNVNVSVVRCGLLSDDKLLIFSVKGGEQRWKEIFSLKADRHKYKILIEPSDETMKNDEDYISGQLRVRQMSL